MNVLKKKLTENWKFILCAILIGIVLFPMVYTIFYMLPYADDFIMATTVNKNSCIIDAFYMANEFFMSWTGLWPYMFFETAFNPVVLFSLESYGIGIEMILLFAAFIISLFAAITTAAKRILGVTKRETIAVYILAFLFVFLNTNIYSEIFYWFVGSSYMWAMTLGLLTITFTIQFFYSDKNNRRTAVLLCIVGALACNFFQNSILPGMVYIALWSYFSVKEGKPKWKESIPFWFMFVSGVVSVAAPGNYVRYTSYTSEVNLLKTIIETMKISVIILKHMIQQPLFIAVLVMGIYIGIRQKSKTVRGIIYPILVGVGSLVTLIVNAFPIALGYSGVGWLPNRIYFLLDFVLMVGMIVTSICIGMYVKGLSVYAAFVKPGHLEMLLMGFTFLLLYSTLVYGQCVSKLPWSRTVAAIGNIKELHAEWQECLIEIRDSKDENVVIEMDKKYIDSMVLQRPIVTGDVKEWRNEAVAGMYGKETVVVIEREEK